MSRFRRTVSRLRGYKSWRHTIMQALEFWKAVTVDHSNLLERFVEWLHVNSVRFCLIGGQAVNAYVEPLVSLDLDVVVAAADLDRVRTLLPKTFATESFPHSLNVSIPGSDLRIRIQLDARHGAFVDRADVRDVLSVRFPVARIEDVLQGKIWAVEDSSRRPSKRQKDLADISRLLEKYPHLRPSVPTGISISWSDGDDRKHSPLNSYRAVWMTG